MTVLDISETKEPQEKPVPRLARMKILHLAVVLTVIAVVWRQVDIFVLGLGDTWMNILPNKLFTLLIMIGVFWYFRRSEIGPVLGITRENIRAQVGIGIIVGLSMYLIMDALPVVIYGMFLDTSYPLELHIIAVNMLWYQLLFFLCNGFVEEGLFRGLLQNGLREYVTPNRAILRHLPRLLATSEAHDRWLQHRRNRWHADILRSRRWYLRRILREVQLPKKPHGTNCRTHIDQLLQRELQEVPAGPLRPDRNLL